MVTLSVIIPAYNEAALVGETLASVRSAAKVLHPGLSTEVIVVDNGSSDATRSIVLSAGGNVRVVDCGKRGAACARNQGAFESRGEVLCFLDADTLLPKQALVEALAAVGERGMLAGIAPYCSRDGGWKSGLWWTFWNLVRCLPLPRAKAMPAFMFCTRAAFDEFGPFDERVAIGEEWPILAGVYATRPRKLAYLWSLRIPTSSRRMELVRFGYVRLFVKYVWAVLAFRGRVQYDDSIRHAATVPTDGA